MSIDIKEIGLLDVGDRFTLMWDEVVYEVLGGHDDVGCIPVVSRDNGQDCYDELPSGWQAVVRQVLNK